MHFSILIVNYNTCALLERCLHSIVADAAYMHDVDIIVVDNHSHDASCSMVQQRFPQVQLLALTHNVGFSAALNQAAKLAKGEVFLLLNPDAALLPHSLAGMQQALLKHTNATVIGFRQINSQGYFQLACGLYPGVWQELLRCFVQKRLDAGSATYSRILDFLLRQPLPVAWVAGSSLLVWRQAFERVGGFDAGYFLYFEDIDFCLRLQHTGARIIYDPSVTLIHERGASAKTATDVAQKAYRQSQIRFWNIHHGFILRHMMRYYVKLRSRHLA